MALTQSVLVGQLALEGALRTATTGALLCGMLAGLGLACTPSATGGACWGGERFVRDHGAGAWTLEGRTPSETVHALLPHVGERVPPCGLSLALCNPAKQWAEYLTQRGLSVKVEEGRVVGRRVVWTWGAKGWWADFGRGLSMEEVIGFEAG